MTSTPGPLETAKDLKDALKGMTAELRRLSAYGHRNRRLIWITVVSLVLDLALTVAVFHNSVTAGHAAAGAKTASSAASHAAAEAKAASSVARQIKVAQVVACQDGNRVRAGNVLLWDRILALPPQPGTARTKTQEKEITALFAYIHTLFAPRACGHT